MPVMTSVVAPVTDAPWQVLQSAVASSAVRSIGPCAVCARWHPAQPSALSPSDPLFVVSTWGPPSARAGTAARMSQRAPQAIMSASRLTVLTSFLPVDCCGWAVPARPAVMVCVRDLLCSIVGTSVAPYLDAIVRGVGHVDPSGTIDRDPHRERELAVGDAMATEESEMLGLLVARFEGRIHEDALPARVHDEHPARVVSGDAARQPQVAGTRASADLPEDRAIWLEHEQAAVVAVGHVPAAVLVDGDTVREQESFVRAQGQDQLPRRVELEDPLGPAQVGHVQVAAGVEGESQRLPPIDGLCRAVLALVGTFTVVDVDRPRRPVADVDLAARGINRNVDRHVFGARFGGRLGAPALTGPGIK